MQHFSAKLHQVFSRQSNKVSLRRGRASQKNSSRSTMKIKEYNNGTPAYKKTRATINQRKTSWHRLGIQDQNKLGLCTTVGPSTTKEEKNYSDLCGHFPTTSIRGKKYIYVMYVYNCNSILTTEMKNRSENEMIRAFTSLPEYLKAS